MRMKKLISYLNLIKIKPPSKGESKPINEFRGMEHGRPQDLEGVDRDIYRLSTMKSLHWQYELNSQPCRA
jgi:hypothetical protein